MCRGSWKEPYTKEAGDATVPAGQTTFASEIQLPIRWGRRTEEGPTFLARRSTAADKARAAQIEGKASCATLLPESQEDYVETLSLIPSSITLDDPQEKSRGRESSLCESSLVDPRQP
jgi:hypothetical protein